MQYRTLGNSGAVVSTFALGTMTFGAEADEVTSHAILDDYVAAGGNFIDTADVYGSGVSEEIIGRWLAAHRTQGEQVVIATKGRFSKGGGPNDLGTSRRHLGRALDALAAAPRRRADRPLSDARLGRSDASGGDVAIS